MKRQSITNGQDILGLVAFLAICLAVSAIGGLTTTTSVTTWYPTLQKPALNPPDWVFGPVWTALYILMAIAAWRVWRCAGFSQGSTALTMFFVQLALNLGWSFLFFGYQRVDLALVEIVVLLLAIVATAILFWRIDRIAGALFVPYVLWVSFATYLNGSIWALN